MARLQGVVLRDRSSIRPSVLAEPCKEAINARLLDYDMSDGYGL